MKIATEEQAAKLKDFQAKIPNRTIGLLVLRTGEEFWVMSPTRQQWAGFKKQLMDPKRKDVAAENLVASCCIEPSKEKVQEMFEKRPLLVETLSEKISELGGRDDEAMFMDFPDA